MFYLFVAKNISVFRRAQMFYLAYSTLLRPPKINVVRETLSNNIPQCTSLKPQYLFCNQLLSAAPPARQSIIALKRILRASSRIEVSSCQTSLKSAHRFSRESTTDRQSYFHILKISKDLQLTVLISLLRVLYNFNKVLYLIKLEIW